MRAPTPFTPSALGQAWQRLARREQTLVLAAASVVGLALLWWVLLAPALRTLQGAGAQHERLDAQLQHMQALQAEAQQLQAQPRTPAQDAARTLQASASQTLGASARLVPAGERTTITLTGANASALATWLAQARSNAHAVTQEAHLTRSNAPGGAAQPGQTVRWDGQIVLSLPAP